ncbi:hypothetical protein I350_07500 [Cryptococcus amylolentus CBS 6273]|uniref:Uncharacterized protein n=1 Tax=Cryptococcus amylolentus CBS 6273 TaxID=1296118 RepID=A0A1E3JEM5_9TREE|nr:hypothetical protein I350_07500 [Cryptococcus amylolentus CBS 6273]
MENIFFVALRLSRHAVGPHTSYLAKVLSLSSTASHGVLDAFLRTIPILEEVHWTSGVGQVEFRSPASGDRDGFILDVKWLDDEVGEVRVQGGMEGYIKAHSKRPLLDLLAVVDGVGLEVAIEKISEPGSLASDISGRVEIPRKNGKHWAAPVWFVERQGDGAKVWTSAIWLGFQGER